MKLPHRRVDQSRTGVFFDRERMGGRFVLFVMAALTAITLTACNVDLGGEEKYPTARQKGDAGPQYEENDTVFGEGGLFGAAPKDNGSGGGGGVGVNSLLWRASLDTISFMPLVSADPFGGVIITDWYTPPATPDERFKVNVYILGRALRADGIRASVFRQQNQGGTWIDAPVALNTATDLENAILTRARQLRQSGQQE
ncbi:DUF3576 domain-containing protein [Dongia rigui]|uniref:DUF3576 domain-containing protein n=1 Tax=Dongia rigui TaxID=940149 RepID=A0ABU5DXV5_9PROT|nr:DUF3576 domain-containing protein [Dongia rigui]MDY0872142.1 DUF3576 domain-containing protein [Dongia rigui]